MNKLPFIIAALLLLAACANLGHPNGGPRDVTPPRYVASNPVPGATNVKSKKFTILFDENIQLDNPGSKVAISPTQKEMPEMFANGRRLDITLRDSLLPNTTYSIDLADAVKDLNEGNVLDGLAIDFATGDSIDTLQISGMVLHARDLEPAQGMLVGVYSNAADSNIISRRFERIARTNQLGQFTVRNLAPGEYQLFALNDQNSDYFWDRTEDVAFSSVLLTPTVEHREVIDTIAEDSVNITNVFDYLPNNVLLTWFNEEYSAQYLKNYKRDERHLISLEMATAADSLPELTIVQVNSDTTAVIPLRQVSLMTHSQNLDSIKFWLRDSAIISADTLMIETRYRRVDTLSNIVWQTDTLKFNFRSPKKKEEKKKKNDTVPEQIPVVFLNFSHVGSPQEVNRPLQISFQTPIDSLPSGAIRLEYKSETDTAFFPIDPQPMFVPSDTFSHVNFHAEMKWIPGGQYQLVADSLAVTDVTGHWTNNMQIPFSVRNLDEYSSIKFVISGLPDSCKAIVELLNESDQPMRTTPVIGGEANFQYLLPATFYARLFIDSDEDGKWTNGDLKLRRQPEDVYYFSKKLALKKNWDRTEEWNINALPADQQKPEAIKKNKPRKAAGAVADEEEEEIDPDSLPYNPYEQF